MSECCDPREYDDVFTAKYARRRAAAWRRSGLDDTATKMVDAVTARDLSGVSVLEIGGGVGTLHIELLRRGASTATNVELSSGYEPEAQNLLSETGMRDRVERRITNLATEPDVISPADIVVLHRVVCCYPDFRRLLGAAADHANRTVVFSFPPRNAVTRLTAVLENVGHALRRREFRAFVHSPDDMNAVLADHRHRVVHRGGGRVWQFVLTERVT